MSTGRPSKHIYGAQSWGVAWRGHPAGYTSATTTPALAAKMPRHGLVVGTAFMLWTLWYQNQKRKAELTDDLPYLEAGKKPLSAGATMPDSGVNEGGYGILPKKSAASEETLEQRHRITKAVTPRYPLGNETGGVGPNADVDVSHMGMQVGFHNKMDYQVQVTDLELLENPEMHPKGYSFQKMSEAAFNEMNNDSIQKNMFATPCSEFYADVRFCEQKFGWRAHRGNRRSVHKHELPCSPELRKYHRCMDAMRERQRRLHQVRVRQSRGEQVGLKSDPAPGESRPLRPHPWQDQANEAVHTNTVKEFFVRHGRSRLPLYDYEERRPDQEIPGFVDEVPARNKRLAAAREQFFAEKEGAKAEAESA